MDLIGKITVKVSKKDRRKSFSLTVGLFCIALAIIIEFFFAPYASLALVVPFFILLNLKLRMGKNSYVKDVSVNIAQDDVWRILTISHSVYRKNVLCSCRYLVPKHENIRTHFYTSNEQLEIIFKSKVIYLFNETILETDEKIKQRRVRLFLPQDNAVSLSEKLLSNPNMI